MNETTKNKTSERTVRPILLSIVCIITYVYNGLIELLLILLLFFPELSRNTLNSFFPEIEISYTGTYLMLSVLIILFFLILLSINKMWRLKKTGLYIYIMIKTALIILLFITDFYSFFNLAFSIIFILLFLIHLPKFE